MSKLFLKITMSVILTIVLAWLLLKQVSLEELVSAFRNMDARYLFPFVFVLIVEMCLKGFRYSQIHKTIGLYKLILISFIHGLALIVIPARGGEFAFLYLLKKNDETYSKAVGALALFRLMDVLCVILLLFISLFFIKNVPNSLARFYPFIIVFALLICLVLASLVFLGELYMKLINVFSSFRFSEHLKNTVQSFNEIEKKQLASIFISSIIIWIFTGLANYFLLRSMIEIDVFTSFAISSMFVLALIIPVQGFMGFGTMEAPLYLLLLLFGFTAEQALATSFVAHMAPLIFVIGLGGLSLTLYRKISKRTKVQNPKLGWNNH